MDEVYLTRAGHKKLTKELEFLRNKKRRQLSKAVGEARAHGDLSENAEYDAAKERQAFVEKRIRDIESRLSHAEIIDTQGLSSEKVVFGSVVVLENLDTGEQVQYEIVGPDESDVKQGKISSDSPVGRALIGKKVEDEVNVRTPGGIRNFQIVRISPGLGG